MKNLRVNKLKFFATDSGINKPINPKLPLNDKVLHSPHVFHNVFIAALGNDNNLKL